MNKEILDLDEFMERVQDDKELLLELLDIFSEDYTKKRILLEKNIKKNDYNEVRGIAHSLKGASSNISAKPLHQLMSDLEDAGINQVLDGAEDLLKRLDVEYKKLSDEMDEIKKSLSE